MNFHDERQKIKDRSVALHVDLDSEQNAVDATIQYYEEHAEEFTTNTLNADMASIRSRFLAYLPTGCRILDFG